MVEVGDLLDELALHGEGMAEAVSLTDPDASVPTTPGWTVRDLVRHTGGVHRWATEIVATARQTSWRASTEEIVGEWPADDDLAAWLRDGLADLHATLLKAPDDLECWTFKDAPTPKHFWARRQAHEIAIHRADAESVTGTRPAYEPWLAADGISELVVATLAQPHRQITRAGVVSLAFEPNDSSDYWRCEIGPSGFTVSGVREDADCTVRAPVSDLYLFAWNRLDPSHIDVSGDAGVVDIWRAVSKV